MKKSRPYFYILHPSDHANPDHESLNKVKIMKIEKEISEMIEKIVLK